jgi:imidazole glycerol-phosphate synthase subunit HisH
MIIIIDYKMGNLGSIFNMLKKIGISSKISSSHDDILSASKLILPGVGAFDNGMQNLKQAELISVLNEKVLIHKAPILGICLGMQLFTRSSEEGKSAGLGWIAGSTSRFRFDANRTRLRIPHMGWNTVAFKQDSIFHYGYEEEPRFYFVHSYHVVCDQEKNIAGKTLYGYEFVSALQKDNIYGVQFHPEKSHKFGMRLLRNFVELSENA